MLRVLCLKGWGRHGLLCPFRLAVPCVWLLAALVHCVLPWVAPSACDSTLCCAVCLIVRFMCRFTSLLGVGGIEHSVSGTLGAGLCLMVVPLPLWGGCFALSR
ncbi:hypothetical protein Taro_053304 [Colocasia esculenta]|uniref:Uncharacterized protein n=1 Tax=Colocasia esculenta TaxID=4460 RepID=A0A843XMR7_COLES|nr:hypothetical protein [Colocasia esculenta]